jgi:hypothetical protein
MKVAYGCISVIASIISSYAVMGLADQYPAYTTAFSGIIYYSNFILTPLFTLALLRTRNAKTALAFSFIAQMCFGMLQYRADAEDYPLTYYLYAWLVVATLLCAAQSLHRLQLLSYHRSKAQSHP